jgi:uncharacterized protein (DUF924 family)
MSSLPDEGNPDLHDTTPEWVAVVLQFWFEELNHEQRFKADPALDERMRQRFLALHDRISATPDESLLTDARTALAACIVLDQFSRNMFRGTPRAFASDTKALAIANRTIAKGYTGALSKDERLFIYLPFEHSEDRVVQVRCVELMSSLGDSELTRYAQAHHDIIQRFDRFPHRNAILGRTSTAEETEFLKQPNSSF